MQPIFNRKLKMKDSFSTIFVTYNHFPKSTYSGRNSSVTHKEIPYYKTDILGNPMHEIDREFTHKKD